MGFIFPARGLIGVRSRGAAAPLLRGRWRSGDTQRLRIGFFRAPEEGMKVWRNFLAARRDHSIPIRVSSQSPSFNKATSVRRRGAGRRFKARYCPRGSEAARRGRLRNLFLQKEQRRKEPE